MSSNLCESKGTHEIGQTSTGGRGLSRVGNCTHRSLRDLPTTHPFHPPHTVLIGEESCEPYSRTQVSWKERESWNSKLRFLILSPPFPLLCFGHQARGTVMFTGVNLGYSLNIYSFHSKSLECVARVPVYLSQLKSQLKTYTKKKKIKNKISDVETESLGRNRNLKVSGHKLTIQ